MKNGFNEALTAAAVALLAVILWMSGQLVLQDASPASGYRSFAQLLGLAASIFGILVICWWAATITLAFAAAALDKLGFQAAARRTGALSPAFMRRLATAVLGANLIVLPAAHGVPAMPGTNGITATTGIVAATLNVPATAASSALPTAAPGWENVPESAEPSGTSPQWTPTPVPADPSLLAKAQREQQPATGAVPGEAEVTVKPGDSLWSIAADNLGPFATETEIAGAWPEWYKTNRHLIGEDPSLLRPGQILQTPVLP